jgi:SulP family sulfate permease
LAAVIVTIMLVPQSLAYALIAGLPPEVGLYASIVPLVIYAVLGTSRALAVGPVAVLSLMTASTLGQIAAAGTADYIAAALTVAFMSGGMLLLLGVFRLGFLANFLSHPVISGFITASALLIAVGQVKHIFGVKAEGDTLPALLSSLAVHLQETNLVTLAIGVATTGFLFWVRSGLRQTLQKLGIGNWLAGLLARTGPILAVAATTALAYVFTLSEYGVKLVGAVPQGLPSVTVPSFSTELLAALAIPALLISIVGFVESVSVGQTLAAKRRYRIDPDQELIALGASNMAAGLTSGYPVTGGFARSVVNFDAGAETPAAGAFAAVGLALATMFLTPLLAWLPQATLAATIIVAVMSLVDCTMLKRTWNYSKADCSAIAATILATLTLGVELGISTGVVMSVLIHLYKTSTPHYAIIGRVPGTEHFRNVLRHKVETEQDVLSVRIDESLYFANARFLEDLFSELVVTRPQLKHIVLMCSAVNSIDTSALESLEAVNRRLKDAGITLHLSEVKGPVLDRLERTDFLKHLTGGVFLSQHQAMTTLHSRPEASSSGGTEPGEVLHTPSRPNHTDAIT